MNTSTTGCIPNLVLLLSIATLGTACSNQSVSIPGSELLGQQKTHSCIDQGTGRAIPGCGSATTSAPLNKPKTANLAPAKAAQPIITRKTVITADTPVATATPAATPISPIGVVSSAPKQPTAVSTPKPTILAQPKIPVVTTPPVVAVIKPSPVPKPAISTKSTTRRLTLSGSTTFKTGSAVLNKAGKAKLASLARSLQSPRTQLTRLLIEGHTDSTGSAAANQVLSLKRANAVADYLSLQGLTRSSIETLGHGESEPIADNNTKAGRAKNRRVEITAKGTRQTTR